MTGVHTPCLLCGMCEYGYGCESTPDEAREPLCFYRLKALEDALIDTTLTDKQVDEAIGVVKSWL